MMIIETERLLLRTLSEADAPFVLALLTDPDFRTQVGDRGVHDLESARRYAREGPGASYARHGFGLNVMQLKQTSAAVGLCGLLRRDSHPDVEIGFALLPQARRQGLALEAAAATLSWGFNALGLKRIVAITAPDNARSIRILERIGLRFERMAQFSADGTPSRLFVVEAPTTGGDTRPRVNRS
jgi:[ribosomal protein S5]-alanine N-acetyltransferase